jgi:hypothetical protein
MEMPQARYAMPTRIRPRDGITALRRFVRSQPIERCDFCGAPIAGDHGHLIEPAQRRLFCACGICAEALAGQPDGNYRRVPRRIEALTDFRMTDAEWDGLGLPIDMAFLLYSTPQARPIAFYPGPAGATESLLGLSAWSRLVARNPVLATFEPDVEALLVNRIRGRRACYRVPIDRCYALVGLMRTRWHGLSGGEEAWQAIENFFAGLDAGAAAGNGRPP